MRNCHFMSRASVNSSVWRALAGATLALIVAIGSTAAADCTPRERRKDRVGGQILGGILGAVIGHQIGSGRGNDIATAAGAIFGSMIGGEIAEDMCEDDERESALAMERAMRDEQFRADHPYEWRGSRYRGNITFTYEAYMDNSYCREYRSTTYGPNGRAMVRTGVICRPVYGGGWYHAEWRTLPRYPTYPPRNLHPPRETSYERAQRLCRYERGRAYQACMDYHLSGGGRRRR
jgi:surface antigen